MSVLRNYYVIAGYDLTGYSTDIFDEWKWTEDGEKYTDYKKKGNIQIFDDPMNGYHFYFGYILAAGDEYDFDTESFSIPEIENLYKDVSKKLNILIEKGIIQQKACEIPFKIIVFEECS